MTIAEDERTRAKDGDEGELAEREIGEIGGGGGAAAAAEGAEETQGVDTKLIKQTSVTLSFWRTKGPKDSIEFNSHFTRRVGNERGLSCVSIAAAK